MAKNILVLKSSARPNSNSNKLADALIEGARENGHNVDEFNVTKMNISGCVACNGCWNSKSNCVIKDGLLEIEPKIENADVLVFAAPLYWSMYPSQLKAVVDRFYQYDPHNGGIKLNIKDAVLMMCGETDNDADFDIIKQLFSGFAEFNGMNVKDMLCVSNVNYQGDIDGNAALDKAKEIGLSL